MTLTDWIIFNNLVNTQNNTTPVEIDSPVLETVLTWIAYIIVRAIVLGLIALGLVLLYCGVLTVIEWWKESKKNKK